MQPLTLSIYSRGASSYRDPLFAENLIDYEVVPNVKDILTPGGGSTRALHWHYPGANYVEQEAFYNDTEGNLCDWNAKGKIDEFRGVLGAREA